MYTEPAVDTLSAALMMIRLRSLVSGAVDSAGSWALEVPGFEGFKLYMALKGEGWFAVSGQRYHLRVGDCLLITSTEAFVAGSDLSVGKRLGLEELLAQRRDGVIAINGGGEHFTVSVLFQFEGHLPRLLFRGLPPAIHIPADADEAAGLRWNIERFRAEYLRKSIGNALILNHLAPIILIQVMRAHLADEARPSSWLSAISDSKLSKVLEAIHAHCGRPWPIGDLARMAGMSRASFAASFKKKIGVTPGEYLTSWRMQVACGLLRSPGRSIAAVASEVGYESESAFSAAFNKLVGSRPGTFRNSALTTQPSSASAVGRLSQTSDADLLAVERVPKLS